MVMIICHNFVKYTSGIDKTFLNYGEQCHIFGKMSLIGFKGEGLF